MIGLDRRDAEAQRQAEVEENARLALWRMDSALGLIVAQEDTRPYYEYQSFYPPPMAFDANHRLVPDGLVVVPSPLLLQPTPFVGLHFQIDPSGRISSPQAPEGVLPKSIEESFMEADQLAATIESLRALTEKLDREALYWHYPLEKPHFLGGRSSGAIRQGNWKLIEFFDTGTIELYNLADDSGEQHNVAEKYSDKTTEMAKRLAEWRRDVSGE